MAHLAKISKLIEEGFFEPCRVRFGGVRPREPLFYKEYEDWIFKNYHGEMSFLARHLSVKSDPRRFWPKVKSILVFCCDYLPHPFPVVERPRWGVASYAQGADYHSFFKEKLNELAKELHRETDAEYLVCTDSSPLIERDLAYQAGLGWIGKNTMLIHPEGSFFFIGEILSTLELQFAEPSPVTDRCGHCQACLVACPTQALVAPKTLDARRCLAYLTIEARSAPENELALSNGVSLFGCDICQTVCPWNRKKLAVPSSAFDFSLLGAGVPTWPDRFGSSSALLEMEESLNRILAGTKSLCKGAPLERAGISNLKRNALVVIGARRLTAFRAQVAKLLDHPKWSALALWALNRLK